MVATTRRVAEPIAEAFSHSQNIGQAFDDQPLSAMSEPALQRAIAEIRRHILVDEKLILRIYHALLNGHVILTGLPGTGKTELAQLIPELLWRDPDRNSMNPRRIQQPW